MTATLKDLHTAACAHWQGRPGGASMAAHAERCVRLLGEDYRVSGEPILGAIGIELLGKLRQEGLSPKSIQTYYGAFRRMLTLCAVPNATWPNAPTPARRTRPVLDGDAMEALEAQLRADGQATTADLAVLLRGAGLRIRVEALKEGALHLTPGTDYDTLHVTGKGGHERTVPVVRPALRSLLRDPLRLQRMRRRQYHSHLRHWREAMRKLAPEAQQRATPHAARHGYAMEALKACQGNIRMVQDLLGHNDPKTTALYLKVAMEDKAEAMMRAVDTP